MPNSDELVRVHVDFNDMETTGQFFVLRGDANGELTLDSQVALYDAEGNSAQGTVIELVEGQSAVVAMTPGSWQRAPLVPVPPATSFAGLVAWAASLGRVGTRTWQPQLTMTRSEMVGCSASTYASPQFEGAVPSSL